MRILGSIWEDGYLDYYCGLRETRVAVNAWMIIESVDGMFFERPKSLQMVLNYIFEIGFLSTIRKIRSRTAEKLRNKRFYSVGLGRVLESNDFAQFKFGTAVMFVAPAHPRCVERVVLPTLLIRPVDESLLVLFESLGNIYWSEKIHDELLNDAISGWIESSGQTLSLTTIRHYMDLTEQVWRRTDPASMRLLHVSQGSTVETQSFPTVSELSGEIRACLFGLGNYAKTQIIPNIPKKIQLTRIHELDPTQIGQVEHFGYAVDTNPFLGEDETYDVCFVAGYHHTHADLAICSIERGGYAVVEKPVVTTKEQLDRLQKSLIQYPGRLFACFHMRYNPLLNSIWDDLGIVRGNATIHYYCTVFEVSLPPRHWYRWPNSGSHIVSNGCHWLDHFLYLNSYSIPRCFDIIPCSNGDSQVHVELENGAVFGMHLTHAGSDRLGVRDHVEMRANGRTAVLESGSSYIVESSKKVLKRKRGNRVNAYRDMYRGICDKILRGEDGDSLESIVIPHKLALELEELRHRKTENLYFTKN